MQLYLYVIAKHYLLDETTKDNQQDHQQRKSSLR